MYICRGFFRINRFSKTVKYMQYEAYRQNKYLRVLEKHVFIHGLIYTYDIVLKPTIQTKLPRHFPWNYSPQSLLVKGFQHSLRHRGRAGRR